MYECYTNPRNTISLYFHVFYIYWILNIMNFSAPISYSKRAKAEKNTNIDIV